MTTTARVNVYKTATLLILLILILASAPIVLAEDATKSPIFKDRFEEIRQGKEERMDVKKDALESRLGNFNEKTDTRRENIFERLDSLRERIATKEAALKKKLATFRNKQKAQLAERINNTLTNINEKMVTQMNRHLETITGILSKLEARVNANVANIENSAEAGLAISNAKKAIETASNAVNMQAEKDYVLVATSEAKIGEDLRGVKDQLHNDLRLVRQLIVDARQAVSKAISAAKSASGGVKNGQ